MQFTQPFNAGSVWAISVRTLSGGGGSFITNHGGDGLVISNGTTVSFTTPVGIMEELCIVGIATANATYNFGLTNNTTFRQGTTGASGSAAMFEACCNSSEGLGLSNSGTASGSYSFAGVRWSS